MINENQEQEEVETKYSDKDQLDNEEAGSHGDPDGEEWKLPTVREILKAQAIERT